MIFQTNSLNHVLSLDPTELPLSREGMCWFGKAPDGNINRRKVWGERCSGTNFINALLHRNVPQLSRKGGHLQWKHGLASLRWCNRHMASVFVVRDPFTWSQSLYRNPWHLKLSLRDRDLSSFIREEWVGVFYDQGKNTPERPADRHPVFKRRFEDIWEMRAVKLRHAMVAASRIPNGIFVRFEDVCGNPHQFVTEVAEHYGLSTHSQFQPIDDYKGEGSRPHSGSTYHPLTDADRDYITSRLDPKLEGFFGYMPAKT